MVSTVGTRPNYYEMLGLTPAATGDEIAQAFAREMGMLRVRPIGAAAVISMAFETLRNPTKRRAYDESIGLVRKPEAPAKPMPALRFAGSARWDPMVRPAIDPPPPPPPAPPPTRPDAAFEQRLASIAASVRELAKPGASEAAPPARAQPEPLHPPEAAKEPAPESRVPDFLALRDAQAEPSPDIETRPFEWKRPVLAAAGLILGVALLGAWAGVEAGSETEAQEPEQAVTLAVPPARSGPAASSSALEPVSVTADAGDERRMRAAAAAHRARRTATPQLPRALSEQELEELLPVDVSRKTSDGAAAGAAAVVEQAVAQAQSVAPAPAKLPLSNATIARTIGRIGYACGQVSSVVEGEGTGVFRVTCTSGHSYRAAPVRGRYHFRRLGSR